MSKKDHSALLRTALQDIGRVAEGRNTPPVSQGTDFTQSFDALVWAKAWLRTLAVHPSIATDESTMHGWFANALMRGYDERQPAIDALEAALLSARKERDEARALLDRWRKLFVKNLRKLGTPPGGGYELDDESAAFVNDVNAVLDAVITPTPSAPEGSHD